MAIIRKSSSDVPSWLKKALGGVCFWIGHRRSLYGEYPLGESAMVAELCNLLYANLSREMKIVCEAQYSELIEIRDRQSEFTERSRVDLCVCRVKKKGQDPLDDVEFAFEVKRGGSSVASINADLRRLYELKENRPEIRAFLLLVSEQHRPAQYIDEKSFAVKRNIPIKGTAGHARVRSVRKAVGAVTKLDNAHYACAIEICLPAKRANNSLQARRP